MAALVIQPLPGAGFGTRAAAWLRGLQARRILHRLAGLDTIVLQGRIFVLRARPLGVCRDLVPAIVRCSKRFSEWQIDEALYDDLVQVLSLGLNVSPAIIEQITVPPWELAPVIERIARINGLPVVEAGRASLGEFLTVLTTSTGTNTSPGSSVPPDGHGITSLTT